MKAKTFLVGAIAALSFTAGCVGAGKPDYATRSEPLPAMRWDHRPEANEWTRAAMAALSTHAADLTMFVPDDIDQYCPAYPEASEADRMAFWSGLFSALAKHESTWRPEAVGGGGRWFGLVQIAPATARGYGCQARSGEALKDGALNLSCALRIASTTVQRDGVISEGMGGIAADWGPFHSVRKRNDIAEWTAQQSYCKGP